MARVRCQYLRRECGSVRIGSVVCWSQEQFAYSTKNRAKRKGRFLPLSGCSRLAVFVHARNPTLFVEQSLRPFRSRFPPLFPSTVSYGAVYTTNRWLPDASGGDTKTVVSVPEKCATA